MTLLRYLKDQRAFFLLYGTMLVFVSIVIGVSAGEEGAAANILYLNTGCLLLAALYLAIRYYTRLGYHRQMLERIESGQELIPAAWPQPQTADDELMLELLQRLDGQHLQQLQRLHEQKRDHQDFILSWIHEVKLPIAAGRLLIDNSSGKPMEQIVDQFEDELDQIERYVEQALYYSRIDSFSKDYFITDAALRSVVTTSVKKYAKLFIAKRMQFVMEDVELTVQSDYKWLAYVVDQLMANALKYTAEGGVVQVSCEEDAAEIRLLLRDSGTGIKPEDLPRVFEKGFTGSNGRGYARSTGMGLYLAQQLVLKLGHRLSIRSEEGRFTEVTIHFPKFRSYYDL